MKRGRKSFEELEGEREIILIDCNFSFSKKIIRLVREMWRDGYRYKYIAKALNLKEIDVVLIIVHLMHQSKMIKYVKRMKILDVCCGGKMFWYDKKRKNTTYMDIRKEVLEFKDRNKIRKIEINPDLVGDFRKIPFNDNYFDLVVFDPPHLINGGKSSWIIKKYGKLNKETWQDDLKQGFDECLRVLKPSGVLLFKWNDDQIKSYEVFKIFGQYPILGDKKSKTKWSVFVK